MTYGRGKWFLIASGLVVVTAIATGMVFIGGPEQARADKRDATRLSNFSAMAEILDCHYRKEDRFPEVFQIDAIHNDCIRRFPDDDESFDDPLTEQPYSYAFLSKNHVQFCTVFEATPERLARLNGDQIRLDIATGCYSIERN